MDISCFDKYARQLSGMNRAVVKGYKAPHKLVLMMAICKLVDDGTIVDNRICLNAELDNKFKELWKEYIDSDEELSHDCVAEELFRGERNVFPFKCNIANPFFHLSGEPFWTLKKSKEWRLRSSWSLSALRTDYEYAEIEEDLFSLLSDKVMCERIFSLLLAQITSFYP